MYEYMTTAKRVAATEECALHPRREEGGGEDHKAGAGTQKKEKNEREVREKTVKPTEGKKAQRAVRGRVKGRGVNQ